MILLLTKPDIQLQVRYTPPKWQVLPLSEHQEDDNLPATTAQNEEWHLQAYLNGTGLYNPSWQIADYFGGRGWQVELLNN